MSELNILTSLFSTFQWISTYDVLEEIAFLVQIGGKVSHNLNVNTRIMGAIEVTQTELVQIGNWTYHNLHIGISKSVLWAGKRSLVHTGRK